MIAKEKILDDIARMAGGGASIISGLGKQFREDMRARLDDLAVRLDLVPRDDFERLETLLSAALEHIESLEKRLDRLEGKSTKTKAAPKKQAKSKKRKT